MVCATFLVLKKSRTRGSRPALFSKKQGVGALSVFSIFLKPGGRATLVCIALNSLVDNSNVECRTLNVEHFVPIQLQQF